MRFVDDVPPPKTTAKWDHSAIAARLRARPGEWAICFRDAPEALRVNIVRGSKYFPLDEFEVHTEGRFAGSNTCDISIRYIGKAMES